MGLDGVRWNDVDGEGWVWTRVPLEDAVRGVIKGGGEEGRFEEKGRSRYFEEYYGGENWRENFAIAVPAESAV